MATFAPILLGSIATSILVTRFTYDFAPLNLYLTVVAIAISFQCIVYGFWMVVLWPKLFSPLRQLPTPEVFLPIIQVL